MVEQEEKRWLRALLEEEGVGAAGPGAETFIAVDIRDGCGGGVGNRRMVIDPGSGKRTGGCGRRKNGRG